MSERSIITNESPKSPTSEAYRTLRTNIQFSNIDEDIKSIVFTSSGPAEGKSTTAVNLAVTMAQVGKRVLILDADLRKPTVHKFFNKFNSSGLTTIVVEGNDYKELVQDTDIENLEILTTGPIPPNPSELLGSKKMKSLLSTLKDDYDMVIIDSPPVGLVTDASVLSTIADSVILVCAVGQAQINAAKNSKALLEKVNANILGVVMNKIPLNEGGYYKYHYSSYYNYAAYYGEDKNYDKKSRRRKKRAKSHA